MQETKIEYTSLVASTILDDANKFIELINKYKEDMEKDEYDFLKSGLLAINAICMLINSNKRKDLTPLASLIVETLISSGLVEEIEKEYDGFTTIVKGNLMNIKAIEKRLTQKNEDAQNS